MIVFHLICDIIQCITISKRDYTWTEKTIFYVEPPKEIHDNDDDTFREYTGKTDKNYMGRTMLQHVLQEASIWRWAGLPCAMFSVWILGWRHRRKSAGTASHVPRRHHTYLVTLYSWSDHNRGITRHIWRLTYVFDGGPSEISDRQCPGPAMAPRIPLP